MIRSGRSRTERRCPHCRRHFDLRAWARHVAACAKTAIQLEAEATDRLWKRRLKAIR